MAINNNGYWPFTVRPGDILRDANGVCRKVIEANTGRSGYTTTVTFLIKRRSWTSRPITVLNYVDLKMRGFKPIENVRVPLTVLETLIQKETAQVLSHHKLRFHAEDVL